MLIYSFLSGGGVEPRTLHSKYLLYHRVNHVTNVGLAFFKKKVLFTCFTGGIHPAFLTINHAFLTLKHGFNVTKKCSLGWWCLSPLLIDFVFLILQKFCLSI